MTIEHRCPTCVPSPARPRAVHSARMPPPRASGSLTFTCPCGSAATVSTVPGPGRELARLGWTFRFVGD